MEFDFDFDLRDKSEHPRFLESVQRFMKAPMIDAALALHQHEVVGALNFYDGPPARGNSNKADIAWLRIFEHIDFSNTRDEHCTFEIGDKDGNALVLKRDPLSSPLGVGRPRFIKATPRRAEVVFDLYGGSIGWRQAWFDKDDRVRVIRTARDFRMMWYAHYMQAHYDMISAAAPTHPVSSQSLKELLDSACDDIVETGRHVDHNSGFAVIIPAHYDDRMAFHEAISEADHVMELFVTPRLRTADLSEPLSGEFIVSACGRDLKSCNRMPLTVLAGDDDSADQIGAWGRYGMLVGNPAQLRSMLLPVPRVTVTVQRSNEMPTTAYVEKILAGVWDFLWRVIATKSPLALHMRRADEVAHEGAMIIMTFDCWKVAEREVKRIDVAKMPYTVERFGRELIARVADEQ